MKFYHGTTNRELLTHIEPGSVVCANPGLAALLALDWKGKATFHQRKDNAALLFLETKYIAGITVYVSEVNIDPMGLRTNSEMSLDRIYLNYTLVCLDKQKVNKRWVVISTESFAIKNGIEYESRVEPDHSDFMRRNKLKDEELELLDV